MDRKNTTIALALTLAGLVLPAAYAAAQPRTELRDPLRGVSFHSIELSEGPLNELEIIEGSFADTDRLTLGLSALVFDGSPNADEYVLWIRHEGRRWLDFGTGIPVVVSVDGKPFPLAQVRAPQPFVGDGSRLFEKIEFHLSEPELALLLDAQSVRVRLQSGNGIADKRLTNEELRRAESFYESISVRSGDTS